jgi:hypothetical protein
MPILSQFKKENNKTNDITCILNIEPLKQLMQTIEIPWYTTKQSSIYAHLNSTSNKINTEIYIPNLSNGKINIDSINLKINNEINNEINIALSAATNVKHSHLSASLNLEALNNQITTILSWDNNNTQKTFAGEFAAQTKLSLTNTDNSHTNPTQLVTTTNILPI